MSASERVRALDTDGLCAFAERVCARLERQPGPVAERLLGRGRGLLMTFRAWRIVEPSAEERSQGVRALLDWSIATREVFAT